MNNIILSKDHIYSGNLLLVNTNFPLLKFNENAIRVVDTRFSDVLMKQEAVNALKLILEKIGCSDEIVPVSGYRSVTEQIKIYENSINESGEEFTRKFVALPYHSEHHTGLAIDLALKKDIIDFICPEFPYEGICDEFRKVAPYYGFVQRYPSDKEQITGIAHEPWHFRYVGYPHSEIMSKNGLTLEEYIDFVKEFPCNGDHLKIQNGGKVIEVFYVSADGEGITTISIPQQAIYQVSGNNTDGFIVTLWRNNDA